MSETNVIEGGQEGHEWADLWYSDGNGRVGVMCVRCGTVFFITAWIQEACLGDEGGRAR